MFQEQARLVHFEYQRILEIESHQAQGFPEEVVVLKPRDQPDLIIVSRPSPTLLDEFIDWQAEAFGEFAGLGTNRCRN